MIPEDLEAGWQAFRFYCCWQKDSAWSGLPSWWGRLSLVKHLLASLFSSLTCQQRDDCLDFLTVLFSSSPSVNHSCVGIEL